MRKRKQAERRWRWKVTSKTHEPNEIHLYRTITKWKWRPRRQRTEGKLDVRAKSTATTATDAMPLLRWVFFSSFFHFGCLNPLLWGHLRLSFTAQKNEKCEKLCEKAAFVGIRFIGVGKIKRWQVSRDVQLPTHSTLLFVEDLFRIFFFSSNCEPAVFLYVDTARKTSAV